MPVVRAPDITDADLEAAFKAHTEGEKTFTRRMAINIADWFCVTPRFVVLRLEKLGLLKGGSWDWFLVNGGITQDHIDEAREDRKYNVERLPAPSSTTGEAA